MAYPDPAKDNVRAQFNIHGLPLLVTSDHPLPLTLFEEELRAFRVDGQTSLANALRFTIQTLPSTLEAMVYAPGSVFYWAADFPQFSKKDRLVSEIGMRVLSTSNRLSTREIHAAVAPAPCLFPEPAYHHLITQSLDPWFKRRGLFFLHAGCVAENGQGILLAGPSRAGKSILSVSALREGFRLLSDEQPLLSSNNGRVCVLSFPRRVRLDRSVAASFPELKGLKEDPSLRQLLFAPESLWPECLVPSCEPRILLFPHFQLHGRGKLTRMSPAKALAFLLKDDYFLWYEHSSFRHISRKHLALLERLARRTPAFSWEYGRGDIPRAPSLFRRLLR